MTEMDVGVAHTLAVDAMTISVWSALREQGIEPILLKGRSFAAWLYADNGRRTYGDCDLLLSSAQRSSAEHVLVTLGFAPTSLPPGSNHGQAWVRAADGAVIDLHTSIWGASDHAAVWQELSKGTERLQLGPIEVTVLDEPGRCVHAVLHWVQHPTEDHPRADLDRAIDQVDEIVWTRAVDLARRIGADEVFVHGLMTHPMGAELTRRLGVATSTPPSRALSLLLARDRSGAATIEWFLSFRGWRARGAAIRHKVFPTVEYLRVDAADMDGRRSIASLYLSYWRRQVGKAPGALVRWFQVWRSAR